MWPETISATVTFPAIPGLVYCSDQVSQAIIVSQLRYAPPVWSGFLTADLINRIQSLLKRLFRFGYSTHPILFHDLSKSCSAQRNFSIICTDHTTAFMTCYPAMFLAWKVNVYGDMILCCHPVLVACINSRL